MKRKRITQLLAALAWLAVISSTLPPRSLGAAFETEATHESSSRRWSADESSPRPPIEPHLAGLGAREVGCLAACQWLPASMLRQRGQTISRIYCQQPEPQRQAAQAVVTFLNLQAAHQEDVGAAASLRAYYGRIALSQQQLLLEEGETLTARQAQKQQQLMEEGFAAGLDLSSLQRQTFDWQDSRLQLESEDDRLRQLLARLVGIDYRADQFCLEPLTVQPAELDEHGLVAWALSQRRDLQAWRCLCGQISERSAPLVASGLASAVVGYGLPLPALGGIARWLHCSADAAALASSLRQEIATIIRLNEDQVRQAVGENCSRLRLAYERWRLQVQRIDSWQARLEQLDRLQELGQSQPEQRLAAEAGLLQARQDEIARRLDAKLAEIDLAESTGGLATRCCRGEAWLVTGR